MTRTWRRLLPLAALLFLLPAVVAAAEPPVAGSVQPAAPDPQADLAEALARGDLRFVGLAGPTLVVPGVEEYAEQYQASHGVRLLPVADEAPADGKGVLDNLASYRYALRYNQLLLEFLRSQ